MSFGVPPDKTFGSSSDPFWFREECEEEKSSFREEYCDEVDAVGVIMCSQLSPSGGRREAFIAEVDARSTEDDRGEEGEDGNCSSRE